MFAMLRFHVCFEFFDINYVDVYREQSKSASAYDDNDEHNLSPYTRAFFPHSPNVIQIMTRNIHHTNKICLKKSSSKQAMHIKHCTQIYCILHGNVHCTNHATEERKMHYKFHGKIGIYSIRSKD